MDRDAPPNLQDLLSAVTDRADPAELRARIIAFARATRPAELPPEADIGRTSRGRQFHDKLALDMLSHVRVAGSREALLRLAMARLADGEAQGRCALGYLLLEMTDDRHGASQQVRLIAQAGFQADRVENFRRTGLPLLSGSRLLNAYLLQNEPIDFWATELTRGSLYNGEFDILIDRQRGAWIAAIPLPPLDDRHPYRALVGLFPMGGGREEYLLPRGATQEWRSLEFLRIGYDLLNHQLAGVAEQARAQRRDMLADLTPGIVNHEINQQIRILRDSTDVINLALRSLRGIEMTDPATVTLVEALLRQYDVLKRLSRISSAFNNLEKRVAGTAVPLSQLIDDALALMQFRLARMGVAIEVLPESDDPMPRTDTALLEHVLLNVIMNALDAFALRPETGRPPPRIRIAYGCGPDEVVRLEIANNGPPISEALRERIFERGVTTKPPGHGQGLGLHICRLAMAFLGGSITLTANHTLPPDMTVAFQLRLPLSLPDFATLLDSARPDEVGALIEQQARQRR